MAPLPASQPFSRRFGSPSSAFLVALIAAYYLWTAATNGDPLTPSSAPRDYYGQLTEALLSGRLHVGREPDPGLLALPDPYDSVANRQYRIPNVTHDLSLYRGHFYVYFGVAPVAVLFAPFRLLTGLYLPEGLALSILTILTFLISVRIVRRLGSGLEGHGPFTDAVLVALLGLCNYAPFLLRRPRSYEVAVGAGAAFTLLGIDALSRGLASGSRRGWLALAGAAFGLALASRPTQVLCVFLMLVASVYLIRGQGRPGLGRIALLWGPWLAVAGLVLLYNHARFEDPFEFGVRYQITEWNQNGANLFSLAFLPYNARLNLLAAPMVGPEFPFFLMYPSSVPPPPLGHQAVEAVAGLVPCLPAALAALLWPVWLRRGGTLEWTGFFLTFQALLSATLVFCFGVATLRYQWDFLPVLLVSAALGWSRLLSVGLSRGAQGMVSAALAALVLYSSALNVSVGFSGSHDWLKNRSPAIYEAIEDAFLPIQRIWFWLAPKSAGMFRIEVLPPEGPPRGRLEALLAVGGKYRHDVLCMRYASDETAVFRFHHRGSQPIRSERVHLNRGAPHVIEAEMGSLIPVNPRVLGRLFPDLAARSASERLVLRVDGKEVLSDRFDFIPAMPQQITVGFDRIGNDQCPAPFSGTVVSATRSLAGGGSR